MVLDGSERMPENVALIENRGRRLYLLLLEGLTAAPAAWAPSLLIYMASCVVSVTATTPRIVMATIMELPAGSYPPG
eukprot:COSAG01_NODE_7347_length_3242_cov_3.487432_1_plen_77_part_00